jgi:hypothetical protein
VENVGAFPYANTTTFFKPKMDGITEYMRQLAMSNGKTEMSLFED